MKSKQVAFQSYGMEGFYDYGSGNRLLDTFEGYVWHGRDLFLRQKESREFAWEYIGNFQDPNNQTKIIQGSTR